MNNRKSKGYWGGGGFTAIPDTLRRSEARHSLSKGAKALLFDLMCMYHRNAGNGDMSIAPKVMKKYNWKSNSGIQAARDELIEKGFLVLSRQGGRNRTSLYALTCFKVDDCKGKLEEIEPTNHPTNEFLLWRQK